MRKPRPQDFEPNFKGSKSFKPDQVDLSGIIPLKPRSNVDNHIQHNRTENRTNERTEIRSEFRTANFPVKRRTKRYSFEFYDDQIQKIRQIKIETEMNGESIAMSEIVREAIDKYLNND